MNSSSNVASSSSSAIPRRPRIKRRKRNSLYDRCKYDRETADLLSRRNRDMRREISRLDSKLSFLKRNPTEDVGGSKKRKLKNRIYELTEMQRCFNSSMGQCQIIANFLQKKKSLDKRPGAAGESMRRIGLDVYFRKARNHFQKLDRVRRRNNIPSVEMSWRICQGIRGRDDILRDRIAFSTERKYDNFVVTPEETSGSETDTDEAEEQIPQRGQMSPPHQMSGSISGVNDVNDVNDDDEIQTVFQNFGERNQKESQNGIKITFLKSQENFNDTENEKLSALSEAAEDKADQTKGTATTEMPDNNDKDAVSKMAITEMPEMPEMPDILKDSQDGKITDSSPFSDVSDDDAEGMEDVSDEEYFPMDDYDW